MHAFAFFLERSIEQRADLKIQATRILKQNTNHTMESYFLGVGEGESKKDVTLLLSFFVVVNI